jgi:transcriptional regulator with XRE-family HTH domain
VKNRSARRSRILSLPNAVRNERLDQGWLAKDFCSRIGISRAQLSAIESRKSGASETAAMKIAQSLQKDFGDLFEIVEAEAETSDELVATH